MSIPSYWREIPRRYRLEGEKCKSCGKIFFPPRLICDSCHSTEFEPFQLKNEGHVLTYTIIRVAPSQFLDQVPYPVAIVELNPGVRICTQITDCNNDDIHIGMPVKLEFRKLSSDGDAGIVYYGYKAVPK